MDKIAFRRGFLLGLASYGIGPEEFGQLIMQKHAGFLSGVGALADYTTAGLALAPVGLGALAAMHQADGDAKRLYKNTLIKYNPINDVSNELAQATRRLQAIRARRRPVQEPVNALPDTSGSTNFLRSLPAA